MTSGGSHFRQRTGGGPIVAMVAAVAAVAAVSAVACAHGAMSRYQGHKHTGGGAPSYSLW